MQHLNPVLSTWVDVLAQLRRMSVSRRGVPLSDRDMLTYTEAIVLCALHLTDLSSRYVGVGSHREIVGWAHFMCSTDVYDVGPFFSDAIGVLRNLTEPKSLGWFKRQLSTYPVMDFVAPIREELRSFLECPTPRGFYVCNQFLSFLTRVTLVDIDVDLQPEYEELEAYLNDLSYPSAILDEMNLIMKDWFRDFRITPENFLPEHGPGATAELSRSAQPLEKYRYLGTDPLVSYVFDRYAGIDVTTYFPLETIVLPRESVFVSVPKSMKTKRGISKEPGALMYLQKGVASAIDDYVSSHPYLSRHVDFHDQEKNAALVLAASRNQSHATIDLSSASDTVTLRCVKSVFRGTPLYPYLVALRSRTVRLPDGKSMVVAKYAPMGSALCFPVETLIFACAVEFAVRRAHRTMLGFFPSWRVYGDDIIVQDALYGDTVLTLESLGFLINETKSFASPTRFRESCGMEGYDGVDVTPMRISRRFYSVRGRITSGHAALYNGLVDMANRAYTYQFPLLRAWLVRVLLDCQVAPPLFSATSNGSLYSPWPDNYRASGRFRLKLPQGSKGVNYQRQEIRIARASTTPLKGDVEDDIEQARLFETLRQSQSRAGDMFEPEHRIDVPCGTSRPRVRRVWVERPPLT